MSGNACDVLELCAIAYLKINEQKEAAKLLRILVNEDYNKIINAQLVSGIYVNQRNIMEYDILKTRIPSQYLYAMPFNNNNSDDIRRQFEKQQKFLLKAKYREVLKRMLDKFSYDFYKDISVFDLDEEYDEEFFSNSRRSKKVRLIAAKNIFCDENKRDYYSERLGNINLPMEYVGILEKMYRKIFDNVSFNDLACKER